MPNYKDGSVFGHLPTDGNFDTIHRPGEITPYSGIYKCTSCGFECVSTAGHPLPPTAYCSGHHPKWNAGFTEVRWHLVAAAIHISRNA